MTAYIPPAIPTQTYPNVGLPVVDSTVLDWIDAADDQGNLVIRISVVGADKTALTSTSDRVQREFVHKQLYESTRLFGLAYITAGVKDDAVANATNLKVLAHYDYHNGYTNYLTLELFLPGLLRLGEGPDATALLPKLRSFYVWLKDAIRPQSADDDGLHLEVFRSGPKYGMEFSGPSTRYADVTRDLNTLWRSQPWFAQWEQETVRSFRKFFYNKPHSGVATSELRTKKEQMDDTMRFNPHLFPQASPNQRTKRSGP